MKSLHIQIFVDYSLGIWFQKNYVKKIAEEHSPYNDEKKVRSNKKSNLSQKILLIWNPLGFLHCIF